MNRHCLCLDSLPYPMMLLHQQSSALSVENACEDGNFVLISLLRSGFKLYFYEQPKPEQNLKKKEEKITRLSFEL